MRHTVFSCRPCPCPPPPPSPLLSRLSNLGLKSNSVPIIISSQMDQPIQAHLPNAELRAPPPQHVPTSRSTSETHFAPQHQHPSNATTRSSDAYQPHRKLVIPWWKPWEKLQTPAVPDPWILRKQVVGYVLRSRAVPLTITASFLVCRRGRSTSELRGSAPQPFENGPMQDLAGRQEVSLLMPFPDS